ncbi:hypothetical protein [Deinococcus aquaedulcis]|uniref:hypothetical protein n=1 Tax=Deinococcus aquaedulcis TaxID=2840455 RepID=UPI001C830E53|nr:hypothetical protein [Deinococcus aquaedulcis]
MTIIDAALILGFLTACAMSLFHKVALGSALRTLGVLLLLGGAYVALVRPYTLGPAAAGVTTPAAQVSALGQSGFTLPA